MNQNSETFWQAKQKFKGVFELLTGGKEAAQFAWVDKENAIGRIFCTTQNCEQVLFFKTEEHTFSDTVKVINPETQEEISSINVGGISRNGDMEFSSGLKMSWTHAGFTSFDRVWQNAKGENLLTYSLDESEKAEKIVAIKAGENVLQTSEFALLVLLGWALIVKEKRADEVALLAGGNPQDFADKSSLKEVFTVKLSKPDFETKREATTTTTAKAAGESLLGVVAFEAAAGVIDIFLDSV